MLDLEFQAWLSERENNDFEVTLDRVWLVSRAAGVFISIRHAVDLTKECLEIVQEYQTKLQISFKEAYSIVMNNLFIYMSQQDFKETAANYDINQEQFDKIRDLRNRGITPDYEAMGITVF